jgi:hypothetical protein
MDMNNAAGDKSTQPVFNYGIFKEIFGVYIIFF